MSRRRPLSILALVAVLAAGCAEDPTTTATATEPSSEAAPGPTLATQPALEAAPIGVGIPPLLPLEAVAAGRIVLERPRFRAHFDAGGVALSHREGPTWHWQLAAIRAGEDGPALDHDATAPILGEVGARPGPDAVRFVRGGLVEEYVDRGGAIEQRFALAAPLPLGGRDLVIDGVVDVEGDRVAFIEGDGVWHWVEPDGSALTLGDVTVFDASGAGLPAELRVEADGTRIVVDGAALARATYPVTIDPQIGPDDLIVSDLGPAGAVAFDAAVPAVAYSPTSGVYLVVWQGDDDSGGQVDGEFEIWGQLLDHTDLTKLGGQFRISTTSGTDATIDAFDPAITWNGSRDEFYVVWEQDRIAGEDEIYGARVSTAGAVIGSPSRISNAGADNDTTIDAVNPAVAWSPVSQIYLIAWDADADLNGESEIWAERLSGLGIALGGEFRLSTTGPDGDTLRDAFRPAIAAHPSNGEWLVVWDSDDDADGATEIWAQRIDASGTEVATDFRISSMGIAPTNALLDAFEADVAVSDAGEYFVVWHGDDDSGFTVDNEYEIWGQRLDASGAEIGVDDIQLTNLGPAQDPNFDADDARVVWDSTDATWHVVYDGDTGQVAGEDEVFAAEFSTTGSAIGVPEQISETGPAGDSNFDAGVAALAYNPGLDDVLVAWQGEATVDGRLEIAVQLVSDDPLLDDDSDGVRNELDRCPGFDDALDADADTVPDDCDLCPSADDTIDGDGDGTPDCADGCALDPDKIEPGQCGCGAPDTDGDGDGTADCNDGCATDPIKTEPGQCGCGTPDIDTDMDGTANCNDGCALDPNKIEPGVCGCGVADVDTDMDTVLDCNDGCALDPNKIEPGVCGCGVADVDTDIDTVLDCNDGCALDPNKIEPGVCGCGVADVDTDMDTVLDCNDGCSMDATKTEAGVCGCGIPDDDDDSDGTANCDDGCPMDAAKTEAGECGCGIPDDDDDSDGTANCDDGCPMDTAKTAAGVCGCGIPDDDGDSDGTLDCDDGCPADAAKTAPGLCGCGLLDADADDDGVCDPSDTCEGDDTVDLDTDGVPDACDLCPEVADAEQLDGDGDGVGDACDACPDVGGTLDDGGCPAEDTSADASSGDTSLGTDTATGDGSSAEDTRAPNGANPDSGCCTTVRSTPNERSPLVAAALALGLLGLVARRRRR